MAAARRAALPARVRPLPHLVPYLGPFGPQRLEALVPDEHERVTNEVRAYLADHPELVAMLADSYGVAGA